MSPGALGWLLIALAVAVAPHVGRVPPWAFAFLIGLALWRAGAAWFRWPLPDARYRSLQLLKIALVCGLAAAVYSQYGGLGRDAGVALLVVLVGFKLLESTTERDYYVTCLLGMFLVITRFFYEQTMAAGVHMLVAVLLLTACLHRGVDMGARLAPAARLRFAGALMLQALPLTVLAFLLFPRLPGPLWGLPKDAYGGISGLSDEMAPGRIAELTLSDEVAFRVQFDGARPPTKVLYWRGPVLWDTDGQVWSAQGPEAPPIAVITVGDPYTYTVTLEPHDRKWLFALELPTATPALSHVTGDLELLTRYPVRQRLSYRVTSHARYRLTDEPRERLQRALALPSAHHGQAIALAAQWRAEATRPEEIVERALNYFREEPFYYSLAPPALEGDTVDEFLFGTRRGFCEHYAAAFTVLMRAAGIPARIVTGYQGGEYNPVGNFLTVRQRDAHAWSEVWLEGRGWVRVDPTAAVSPARVERGIDAVFPETAGVGLALAQDSAVLEVLTRFRNTLDALTYQWNQWVLGYGERRQSELLQRIGLDHTSPQALGMWLLTTLGVVLGVLALLLARRRPRAGDPWVPSYRRYCARLARAGLARDPVEGPLAFAARVSQARPDLSDEVSRITRLYVAGRYGDHAAALPAFIGAVRRFRPRT